MPPRLRRLVALAVLLPLSLSAELRVIAATNTAAPQPVTVDNFVRAETHLCFTTSVQQAGGTGKFYHYREPMLIEKQTVVRANRDTLYSAAVVDLDAGPVTIVLPDTGKRFRSLMLVNEDHYIVGEVVHEAGRYTHDRKKAGTRYMLLGLRTLVDPKDPKDIAEVHAIQDATIIQQDRPGRFEAPKWDPVSQKKARDALLVLASTMPDFGASFGRKDQVNPVRHLVGTAAAWGGNPDKEAIYLNINPPNNDGKTAYQLRVKDVPVDGFWSLSLYNAEGYFEKNEFDAYSVNNLTAKKEADGSVLIQFGGDPKTASNYLPITPGWNYTVRLYRPRAEVLDGTWKFPEPQPLR
jgi:hypothetical protein